MSINDLFGKDLGFVNIGAPNFMEDLALQGQRVTQLVWQPPTMAPALLEALDALAATEEVRAANEEAASRIMAAQTRLVGLAPAREVVPGMTENTILHAGPPIAWEDMCGTMQGAVVGALLYEGRAADERQARELAASGEIEFSPCHEHGAVGPMAGIVSPSMPVHIVENQTHGTMAYCTVNEGLGKVLRFGAFDESVIERLTWIEREFAPAMDKAVRALGGIDTKTIIAQAVQMGDECHNRNKAATSLLFKEVAPALLECGVPLDTAKRVMRFISANEHYFLNLSMPSCKCALDAASGIPNSTVLTAMSRNGVEFGIRVSGLGEQWFTGPANLVDGLLFPGFSPEDANPDLGDSAITETMGIGGFAMGASPAIVQFVGGSVADAMRYTESMREITVAENAGFSLPPMNFRGTATGVDLVKVLESGVLPVINTGIAHKVPGIGQVGAGIVNPPVECFERALEAFAGTRAS